MANENITIKVEGLEDVIRGLDPKLSTDAIRSTTNKLIAQANTQVKRAYTESYNIKQKDLRLDILKASNVSLSAFIRGPKRQKSLSAFKATQTKQGVLSSVKKGDQMFIKSAFIAKTFKFIGNTEGRIYQGVFSRKNPKSKEISKRYPIHSLYTMSIGHLLKSDWIQAVINKVVGENAQRLFNHELEYFIGKYFKKK